MAQYYLTTGNDNITGTNQADIFTGGDPDFEPTGGIDKLQGGGGDDQFHLVHVKTAGTIDGGTGSDTVYMDRNGSLGTIKFSNVETLYIALLTTRYSETPGQVDATLEQLSAFSKIKLNPNFTMGVNFNILGAGGEFDFSRKIDGSFEFRVYGTKATSGLTLTGTHNNDVFLGGAFNDVFDGNGGADRLLGGLGNDTYITDGNDTIIENSNGGFDAVISSVSYQLGENLNALKLSGNAAINGTGNSISNTITGNDSANILDGAGGLDKLVGGLGNDTYVTDGGDKIIENSNGGFDAVISSVSYHLGDNLNALKLSGSAAINATGNSIGNTITGNIADNRLDGGGGNDRLAGGLGNDVLVGGLGNDSFVFDTAPNADSNRDVISDFSNKTGNDDIFKLDNLIFTKLGAAGAMNTAFFTLAGEKQDANDYIIYDKTAGILSYDADGSGAGEGIQFAMLTNHATLTAYDFLII